MITPSAHRIPDVELLTRPQLITSGFDDAEIQRRLRNGTWHRVRAGIYITSQSWTALGEDQRYLLRLRAAMTHLRKRAVASHWSAAIAEGLDTLGEDRTILHVTRPDVQVPRTEAGVHHHAGRLTAEDTMSIGDLLVTKPGRTVVDLACTAPFGNAVVTADNALRRGLTADRLLAVYRAHRAWSGSRKAERVIRFADGRSESPGESLTRVVLARLRLPPPELQLEFFTDEGRRLFARCDLGWPALFTVIEFDGKAKYYRGIDGADPGEIVWREKLREDRLHDDFGLEVVRVSWSDLHVNAWPTLNRRVRKAIARASRRHGLALPSWL